MELKTYEPNYFSEPVQSIIILAILFSIIICIAYIIGNKKEWSLKKRGVLIGLSMGIIWLIAGWSGTLLCGGWNPVDGGSAKAGVCSNILIVIFFFLPVLISLIPSYITAGIFIDQLNLPNFSIIPVIIVSTIIFLLSFSLAGYLIALIIGKFKQTSSV